MSPHLLITVGGALGGSFAYVALASLPWRGDRIVLALNAFGAALLAATLAADSQMSWSPTTFVTGFSGASTSFAVMATFSSRSAAWSRSKVVVAVALNVGVAGVAAIDAYLLSHILYSIYQKL